MFAWVTPGSTAPGVLDGLGSTAPAELVSDPPSFAAGLDEGGDVDAAGLVVGGLVTSGAVVGAGRVVEGGWPVAMDVVLWAVLLAGAVATFLVVLLWPVRPARTVTRATDATNQNHHLR
jgi:hypothetical protein